MSLTETVADTDASFDSRKRKRAANEEDLEIDLNAPEPPSKKALRKAKKSKPLENESTEQPLHQSRPVDKVDGAEDTVPNRGKRSEFGIWIGNLSFATTKQDLLDLMTTDTEHVIAKDAVTRINLPAGPAKHGKFQNKGFAYIDLANAESLQAALQLSEKLLGGRRVLIKDATSFEGRPKEAVKQTPGHAPNKRIFVGNLDFDTTNDDLDKHFSVCGPIQYIQVATFEDSGKCKGFAMIEFEQLSSAQAAMRGWVEEGSQTGPDNLKRSKQRIWVGKMKGRKLRIEYAEDKTTRYNKRFGKDATKKAAEAHEPPIQEVVENSGAMAELSETPASEPTRSETRQNQRRVGKARKQRYTEETVRKLTGAIVEGQGQKVTFEG